MPSPSTFRLLERALPRREDEEPLRVETEDSAELRTLLVEAALPTATAPPTGSSPQRLQKPPSINPPQPAC